MAIDLLDRATVLVHRYDEGRECPRGRDVQGRAVAVRELSSLWMYGWGLKVSDPMPVKGDEFAMAKL